jgi:IS4 transposase
MNSFMQNNMLVDESIYVIVVAMRFDVIFCASRTKRRWTINNGIQSNICFNITSFEFQQASF